MTEVTMNTFIWRDFKKKKKKKKSIGLNICANH